MCKQGLQTCDRTDKAWWPPDLWTLSKLVPLSPPSRRYLLSDLSVYRPTYIHHFGFSYNFSLHFLYKSPAACLRLATGSPALQSCRACDRLKFQAASASGDFVEGWIHGARYQGMLCLWCATSELLNESTNLVENWKFDKSYDIKSWFYE